MNASDVEIYNAIDGSVYFSPEDMEELTAAVQRTATDPLAFVEVGRMYTAMIHKVVKEGRERQSKFYRDAFAACRPTPEFPNPVPRWELTEKGKDRDAFNAAFPEFPSIRYEVTEKGNEHVHPTIVDALRNGGVL